MVILPNNGEIACNCFLLCYNSFFPSSSSCTASRISWSLISGWNLFYSSAGSRSFSTAISFWSGSCLSSVSRSCYRALSSSSVSLSLSMSLIPPLDVEAVQVFAKSPVWLNGSWSYGRDIIPHRKRPAHGCKLLDFVDVAILTTFVTIQSVLKMVAPVACFKSGD